ncbi:serine protein kinase RIO [Candidatus Micrarchaeota archaeon]|nr:serine protein kinase RIO [Candidatus Micrarchaeota archaeon]MBU1165998.1 serine protein kinase RIO [Candidatus Micrarchaeota archaeon]MBU1886782.1 serine protein kinase RIO [Candidatus Micrarchaeota archaeon]
MARKKPLREIHQLKERIKIESEVFDRKTLLDLSKLMKKDIIATVDYPISTGKEANVFRATTTDGTYVAIKIYKVETAKFFRRDLYLDGDPRFDRIKHTEKEIVKAFARKEFKNLQICEKKKIHAPQVYYLIDNMIVMEFLGEGELPYPTMNMVGPLHGEKDLESILKDIKGMYDAGLVHTDMSEYNIMMGKIPYLIDFGQGVVKGHPHAEQFLERDVRNIVKYFGKHGIKRDYDKVIDWIRGKK